MERTICFRLLRTLEEQGLLRRSDRGKYASNFRILSWQAIPHRVCLSDKRFVLQRARARVALGCRGRGQST